VQCALGICEDAHSLAAVVDSELEGSVVVLAEGVEGKARRRCVEAVQGGERRVESPHPKGPRAFSHF